MAPTTGDNTCTINSRNAQVNISGGTFNAISNSTVNIYNVQGGEDSDQSKRTTQTAQDDIEPTTFTRSREKTSGATSRIKDSTKRSNHEIYRPHFFSKPRRFLLWIPWRRNKGQTKRSNHEIYHHHLFSKLRGLPLWIPWMRHKNRPTELQKIGTQIYDVGFFTPRGSFITLFNVGVPAGHPFNRGKVPEDFVPLSTDPENVEEFSEFGPGTYICSPLINVTRWDGETSGLVFESSASEGALLIMPEGSNSEDLRNLTTLKMYADQHAEDWYQHLRNVLGYEVHNGDLHLVTGCDKTSAWWMATFSSFPARDHSLHLSFRPSDDQNVDRTYRLEYSNMDEIRYGPDPREIQAGEDGMLHENQCLFVRTIPVKY